MNIENKATVQDLQSVIQDVRLDHARRDDAIVELQEEERLRLSALEEALEGVFNDIPQDQKNLALAILPGYPPRFWVDATSYVVMARDKRTYQFVKDTRLGRTLIHEGAEVEPVADAVTRYVAERIVERQRASEESWVIEHNRQKRRSVIPEPVRRSSLLLGFVVFGLGMIAGAALLLAYAWFYELPS